MAAARAMPRTPRCLALVTGGSSYVAGHCIAQLLGDGWRVRATARNLDRAEPVRSAIDKIAANASTIETTIDPMAALTAEPKPVRVGTLL